MVCHEWAFPIRQPCKLEFPAKYHLEPIKSPLLGYLGAVQIKEAAFMSYRNRIILATYLPMTAMIMLFNALYHFDAPALYMKFGVRAVMCVTVLFAVNKFFEQKLLVLAFLSSLVSDFFFSVMYHLNPDLPNRDLYGILGFIAAYLFLIAAFNKKASYGKRELLIVAPFAAVFTFFLVILAKYATGFMFFATVTLGVILCFFGLTMVSCYFRRHFTRTVSFGAMLAGIILFGSDMVVALSLFHPDFQGFMLWKENLIWGTYMLGWIIILMIAASDELRINRY